MSILDITITVGNNSPALQRLNRVPDAGKFGIVLHDKDTDDWNHMARGVTKYEAQWDTRNTWNDVTGYWGGFPPTNKRGTLPDTWYMPDYRPDDFAPLPEPVQRFEFALYQLAAPNLTYDQQVAGWLDAKMDGKALNDFHSWTNNDGDLSKMFREYIAGKNLYNPKPMAQKSLHIGGNLVHIIGEDAGFYVIETLDLLNLPPVEWAYSQPHLVGTLTQTRVTNQENVFEIVGWPQLGGADVPFMVIGLGGHNRIEKRLVKLVANSALFNPYS